MATIATFISKPPSSLPSITKPAADPSSTLQLSFHMIAKNSRPPPPRHRSPLQLARASSKAAAEYSTTPQPAAAAPDQRVQKIHTAEEFDLALQAAKNRLVVVEYAGMLSDDSRRIYPFMVELSRTCSDVDFLLVMGDESDDTRDLCRREGIENVPHFSFYKGTEKVHDEEGIGPEVLVGDVLYYGDSHSSVVQLHCRDDVEELMRENSGRRLVVLDVGLKHCGPCAKVYPTVIKLSRSMAGSVVFARIDGDENESCMGFLRDMEVVQVPTFLFIRDGEVCGRYVGSGKGDLIGEILRYQGVRVTY